MQANQNNDHNDTQSDQSAIAPTQYGENSTAAQKPAKRDNSYQWSMGYAPIVAQLVLLIYLIQGDKFYTNYEGFPYLICAEAIALFSLGYFRSNILRAYSDPFHTYFALFLPILFALINFQILFALHGGLRDSSHSFFRSIADLGVIALMIFINPMYFFAIFIYFINAFVEHFASFFALLLEALSSSLSSSSLNASAKHLCIFIAVAAFAYAVGVVFGLCMKRFTIANNRLRYKALIITIMILAPLAPLIPFAVYKHSLMIPYGVKRLDRIGGDWRWTRDKDAVLLRGEKTLNFESDLPKLDGAIPLYPIYYSAVKALYKKPYNLDEYDFSRAYFNSSDIKYSYGRLIHDSADLAFVFGYSSEQLAEARKAGVDFELTPIGKEAFVFLVNEQNPIKSLTIEQIQKIYTGEITNWREVGGNDEEILAFQRDKDSTSQSVMEWNIMQGLKLRTALMEEVRSTSGDKDTPADYRNAENAIGYSFRFYVAGMMKAKDVCLLAINGIEPSPENIQNGSYPLVYELYIAGRKNDISENAQKLVDWFLSDQGQALIEDVGYVPIKNQQKGI
ncbi:MAG: substrate-binding domain-containing protein [Helicobacteraceae bacterium]|nr:substrate-binding domain-containing protein [Helicobacteraceae bacterium]